MPRWGAPVKDIAVLRRLVGAWRSLRAVLPVAAMLAGGCASPLQGPMTKQAWIGRDFPAECDLGAFASCGIAPGGESRFRAIGPLLEFGRDVSAARFSAVRPLYSETKAEGFRRREYLWPVAATRLQGQASSWRVLTAFGMNDNVADPDARFRGAVFPLLFWGRDLGGKGYAAFFPLGGELREFIGRDRIRFFLFPLYSSDVKDDMRSYNLLWPLISWGGGGDVSRLRLFPFYGRAAKRDGATRRFVLWPFWTSIAHSGKKGDGYGYILFPFYGRGQNAEYKTQWFLPPLFKVGHGGGNSLVYAPWPFVQVSHGAVEKLYLWPLWGRRQIDQAKSAFMAWPIVRWESAERSQTVKSRFYVLPFFYHEATRGRVAGPVVEGVEVLPPASGTALNPTAEERYVKIWPVFSYLREGGHRRVRMPDLWPARRTGPVERNWAPLWTLYRSERGPALDETEWLWGLYRNRREPDGSSFLGIFPLYQRWALGGGQADREWSVLGGLMGSRSDAAQRRLRLLYFFDWHFQIQPDK